MNQNPLRLYDTLRIGYLRDEKKQANELQRYGYTLDKSLTNREHMTAYNPQSQKLLYVSNGTNPFSARDIYTDVNLAFGNIRRTSRFQSEKEAYQKAKEKYQEKQTILAGHSLGGNIVSKLDSNPNTKILSFNAASTFGERKNRREIAYRTNQDLVSLLKPGAKKTKQTVSGSGLIPPIPRAVLAAHDIKNIKGKNIFV